MRIDIDIQSCLSSCLSNKPDENQCSSIDIDDMPIHSGGQGKIYDVTHIDGQRVSGLLVKSFDQGFPDNLRHIVSAVRDNKDAYKIEQCIALKALPLFLFTGTLNGGQFYGYVMRKIEGKPFSQIIEDDINSYINLPLENRLNFCLQFVEGMDILYSLTIVHADINGQNLMIDTVKRTLTIIDLDGGAVAREGTAPVVIGKLEPSWLAPEIMSQLAGTIRQQVINVNIAADLWSIACGVHYLLFGLGPFFFLSSACPHDVETYLEAYTWPTIRWITGINQSMEHAFYYYERAYGKVPELHRLLQASFQNDYLNPGRRISAYQWKQQLKQLLSTQTQLSVPQARTQPIQATTPTLPPPVSTPTTTMTPQPQPQPQPVPRNWWAWAALTLVLLSVVLRSWTTPAVVASGILGLAAVASGFIGWRIARNLARRGVWMARTALGLGAVMVFFVFLPLTTSWIHKTVSRPPQETVSGLPQEVSRQEQQEQAPMQEATQPETKEVAKGKEMLPTKPVQPQEQKPRLNLEEGGQMPTKSDQPIKQRKPLTPIPGGPKPTSEPTIEYGNVVITSQPTGAKVYIDDTYKGFTDCTIKIPTGKHVVSLKMSGYLPWSVTVNVSPGKTVELTPELIQEP